MIFMEDIIMVTGYPYCIRLEGLEMWRRLDCLESMRQIWNYVDFVFYHISDKFVIK